MFVIANLTCAMLHLILHAGGFGFNCTIDGSRTQTVRCEGINGVINESEVACVYDSGKVQEKC